MPQTATNPESTACAQSAERDELHDRDAAAVDDAALVRYEAKWRRKLRRLQRAFPERWRVPGLSEEEVLDCLTLRLIEAVRAPAPGERELRREGREWGLLVARRRLSELRKSFRLGAIATDLREAPLALLPVDQEAQWLDAESEQLRARAVARAEQGLSRPQRRWLSAFKLSARAGGFFQSSDEPNLSAAARMLGKNRSSAQRSYQELRARFVGELGRLESLTDQ
jgi:hypothetical protein